MNKLGGKLLGGAAALALVAGSASALAYGGTGGHGFSGGHVGGVHYSGGGHYGGGWGRHYGGGWGWGWGVGFYDPLWYPWGWGWPADYGYAPYYAPYAPYAPAYDAYPAQPAAPAASGGAPEYYWYYCEPSKSYYPYVQNCAAPWQRVAPQPPKP